MSDNSHFIRHTRQHTNPIEHYLEAIVDAGYIILPNEVKETNRPRLQKSWWPVAVSGRCRGIEEG